MTTISVDATWRVSQVVFNTPHDATWHVIGSGEMLLSDPTKPDQPLGVMPGAAVMRTLDAAVMGETVEIDGNQIPLMLVIDAMKAFLEKWRVEDAEKSSAQATLAVPPSQPPPTPVLKVPDGIIIAPEV